MRREAAACSSCLTTTSLLKLHLSPPAARDLFLPFHGICATRHREQKTAVYQQTQTSSHARVPRRHEHRGEALLPCTGSSYSENPTSWPIRSDAQTPTAQDGLVHTDSKALRAV